jgi:hypothetical protein
MTSPARKMSPAEDPLLAAFHRAHAEVEAEEETDEQRALITLGEHLPKASAAP